MSELPIEERLRQLEVTPDDWNLRLSVVQSYMEAGDTTGAAHFLVNAPWIPEDEETIVYAAQVFAATNPAQAVKLLDHFLASGNASPRVTRLRSRISGGSQTRKPVPPRQPAGGSQQVPPQKRRRTLAELEAEVVPTEAMPVDPEQPVSPAEEVSSNDSKEEPKEKVPEKEIAESQEQEQEQEILLDHKTTDKDPESHPDKVIIVSEGEAVHAADLEDDKQEKIKSLVVAISVHLVLIVLFAFFAISQPPPPAPQFRTKAPPGEKRELDSTTLDRKRQKTSNNVNTPSSVISAHSLSNFVLPTDFAIDEATAMIAISEDDSLFTQSMSGFGKGRSGAPGGMKARCTVSQRLQRLRETGGDEKAEDAIERGLRFLASQQDPETGAIGHEFFAGMTGLSLLAYLGRCETQDSIEFGDTVVKAATYLMQLSLQNNGRMTNGSRGDHEVYEHAIATYALSELYTMTRAGGDNIPRLDQILRKSVGIIVNAQSRDGGWPYGFTGEGYEDLSVSGWQIQALKAAHITGLRIPGVQAALDRALKDYLPRIQDGQGAFKYNPQDPAGRDSLTGAALLCFQIWNGSREAEYTKGMKYLRSIYYNPIPGDDYYTPYYNTQAFFNEGGAAWENYNTKFQPQLLRAQNSDGSWLGMGVRKDEKIMNTAWAILMLEVYYRYLPATEKVGR
ncbi:MAG: prenyltransferase/squalene oxidase repeat-containing protein [Verrucomicrobiota bacterium]